MSMQRQRSRYKAHLLVGVVLFSVGSNKGRVNHAATAALFGWTPRETNKAYNNWIQLFKRRGTTLIFAQYLRKLQEAGLRPAEVGCRKGQFVLARYGDRGAYTISNCRFITVEENLAEEKRGFIYDRMIRKYGKRRAHEILSENASSRTHSSIGRAPSF